MVCLAFCEKQSGNARHLIPYLFIYLSICLYFVVIERDTRKYKDEDYIP